MLVEIYMAASEIMLILEEYAVGKGRNSMVIGYLKEIDKSL